MFFPENATLAVVSTNCTVYGDMGGATFNPWTAGGMNDGTAASTGGGGAGLLNSLPRKGAKGAKDFFFCAL